MVLINNGDNDIHDNDDDSDDDNDDDFSFFR